MKKIYQDFLQKHSFWLEDYALFMSIKKFYDAKAQAEKALNAQWNCFWPKKLAKRDEEALLKAWSFFKKNTTDFK